MLDIILWCNRTCTDNKDQKNDNEIRKELLSNIYIYNDLQTNRPHFMNILWFNHYKIEMTFSQPVVDHFVEIYKFNYNRFLQEL